jgi:tetratricopeptide (TPR) repeat protein
VRRLGLDDEPFAVLLNHFMGVTAPETFLKRLSGDQLKARTFELLRTVFQRASREAPLVAVIENLHWLDASSAEFLAHLVDGVAGHPMLLLLTARPEFTAPWLSGPDVETVALGGLDSENLVAMVRTLLGVDAVSSEFLKVLLAKGEGNPLYVEEILRQLRESGGMVIESGQAQLRAGEVQVPETIHDIIAARIDRLAEPVKHTLQVASVVGRHFSLPLLSRVTEANGALETHLGELRTLDFVFLTANGSEPTFAFKHALTQEVAYGSLLERRRRLYHAAVAAGLEALYASRLDDVAEVLAHHYARSAEYEKAVDYAILAAEKAQRRWANTEALAHFETALKRLSALPDTGPNRLRRIDAVVKQAEIMFALGRHAEHLQALEAVRGVVEASADPPRRAAWYAWAGFLHSLTGDTPEVPIAYCREALAIAKAGRLDEIRAFAESCLTHVYDMAGQVREALVVGERALETFEARGNVWWTCRTLWGLSIAAIFLGDWARSLAYCRRALEHGQAVDDRRLKVVGWWRTGWTHIQRGDAKAGLRCCDEALALSPSPFDAAMARGARGYGLIKAGDLDGGIAVLEDVVAWFARSNLPVTGAQFALCLADGYLRSGNRARARQVLDAALTTCRDKGNRALEGMTHRLLAEALAPDEPGEADRHVETALRLLDEVGARNEYAKALVARASLRAAQGESAEARRLLAEALGIFEALGTVDEPGPVRRRLESLPAG